MSVPPAVPGTQLPTTYVAASRPPGVAVIAIFLVVNAVLAVLQLVIESEHWTSAATLRQISELTPGTLLVLAALNFVAAVGLWRGSRGAWVLTMVIVGLSLLAALYLYVAGDPAYLRLAIDVVIVFYLNQRAVRQYFGDFPGHPSALRPPPPSPPSAAASDAADGAPGG